ncbi:unknown [Prevotella sp. CAG:279]|nr:unknown [Prevotella sp. CAG:279]
MISLSMIISTISSKIIRMEIPIFQNGTMPRYQIRLVTG